MPPKQLNDIKELQKACEKHDLLIKDLVEK